DPADRDVFDVGRGNREDQRASAATGAVRVRRRCALADAPPAADDRGRRNFQRHTLALLQRRAAVRRDRGVGVRRLSWRARVSRLYPREGGVYAAALRADMAALSALSQALRYGADNPEEARVVASAASPPPERVAQHSDDQEVDPERRELERCNAFRKRTELEWYIDQPRHGAQP